MRTGTRASRTWCFRPRRSKRRNITSRRSRGCPALSMSRHHTSLSGGFHETGINITYVSSDKPSSVGSRNRPDSRRCDLWLLQLLWIVTGDRYAGSGVGRSAVATGGSTVEINNFAFAPAKLTVPAGTSVSWKFKDSTERVEVVVPQPVQAPPT